MQIFRVLFFKKTVKIYDFSHINIQFCPHFVLGRRKMSALIFHHNAKKMQKKCADTCKSQKFFVTLQRICIVR